MNVFVTWGSGASQGIGAYDAGPISPTAVVLASLKNGALGAVAGIGRSIDAGMTWSQVYVHATTVMSLCSTPSGTYAITYNGRLLRSTDTGISWTDLGQINATATSCTDIGYIGNNTLVVGNGAGANSAFISYNMGSSWSVLLTSPRAINKVLDMGGGQALLLGSDYSSTIGYAYKTTNYGASWTQILTIGYFVTYDAVHVGGGVVLACGGEDPYVGWPYNQIYRSTDYGATWTSVYDSGYGYWGITVGWLPSTNYVFTTIQQINVGTDANKYLYRSSDLGATWPTSLGNQGAMALYGGSGSTLYSGRTSGLCPPIAAASIKVSYDLASTWPGGANAYDPTRFIELSGTPAPVADFSLDVVSGDANLLVNGTDLSTGSPTSWDWDWGDGSPHSTTQNPSHTYTKAGTFTVALTATNSGGSDTETKINYVTVNMVADFTAAPTTGYAPLFVTFSDASLGEPTTWDWDFGDGSLHSTLQNPSHTYTTVGTFTPILVVNAGEASKTRVDYITANATPPTIVVQPVSLVVREGSSATFTVTATGFSLSYQWMKNGVDISGATSTSLAISYVNKSDHGAYTVRVWNIAGTEISDQAVLTVNTRIRVFGIAVLNGYLYVNSGSRILKVNSSFEIVGRSRKWKTIQGLSVGLGDTLLVYDCERQTIMRLTENMNFVEDVFVGVTIPPPTMQTDAYDVMDMTETI
jgi:PKD repeat protein